MTHNVNSTDQLSPVFLGFFVSFCVIHRYVQFWGCFLFCSVIQDISNLEHKDILRLLLDLLKKHL